MGLLQNLLLFRMPKRCTVAFASFASITKKFDLATLAFQPMIRGSYLIFDIRFFAFVVNVILFCYVYVPVSSCIKYTSKDCTGLSIGK